MPRLYPKGQLQNSSLSKTRGTRQHNPSTHESLSCAKKRTTTAASSRKKQYQSVVQLYYNEARERSEPFFPWFSKEKKLLHNGSYEHRVPKIKKQNIILYQGCLCVIVCVIQHRKWHLGRLYSTHTATMPVLTGSVHEHTLTKPSRAGFAVIRLELIEPGAETCV